MGTIPTKRQTGGARGRTSASGHESAEAVLVLTQRRPTEFVEVLHILQMDSGEDSSKQLDEPRGRDSHLSGNEPISDGHGQDASISILIRHAHSDPAPDNRFMNLARVLEGCMADTRDLLHER